jgi:hypothetical protein
VLALAVSILQQPMLYLDEPIPLDLYFL